MLDERKKEAAQAAKTLEVFPVLTAIGRPSKTMPPLLWLLKAVFSLLF